MRTTLTLLFITCLLLSCQEKKRTQLAKHWRVTQMTMSGDLVPFEMTKNIHFNFNEDGIYTLNAGTKAEKGTWSFDIKNMTLTTKEKETGPITVDIITLNDSILIMKRGEEMGEVVLELKTFE